MKGMIFVEVISGQISGQGIVADQVGPGFYKLTWQAETPLSRVISAERMQSMFLFNNPDELNAWLKSVTQEGPAIDPAPAPEKNPRRGRAGAKTTAAKKKEAAASKDAE